MSFREILSKMKIIDDPVYKCNICRDVGSKPYPPDKDGVVRWGACDCVIQEARIMRLQQLIDDANMSIYTSFTFSAYNPATPKQKAAYEEMSKNHRGYYLFSKEPGVGKTHLMAASALNALKNGIPSVIISVPVLLDVIRKRGRDANDYADIEKSAYNIPYLCLDDIGKQRDSDWTEERLFMLVDERYKLYNAGKGHTSFTSKYPLEALARKIDGDIVDRIRGMCKPLYIDGTSKRGY